MKIFVDTNIFLRYLTKDDPPKYEKCKDIFRKAIEGKIQINRKQAFLFCHLLSDICYLSPETGTDKGE